MKKLCVLLSATIGLAGLISLTGCATTQVAHKSQEVYFFANPIYPTNLTAEQKKEMHEKELLRQESELEAYARDYQPFSMKKFYNEPGLRNKEPVMPIANIRF